MKEKSSKHSTANRRRRLLFVVAVAVVVAGTAITVISRQNSAAKSGWNPAPTVVKTSTVITPTAGRTYVTRRIGGQDIQIDAQTGQIKPLTPQEAQKLAEGLAPMLDRSTDGLTPVRHSDGSISMDLQGRFQDVVVARIDTNGKVEQSCVNNPDAAGKFFGLNPQLIKDAQARQKRLANPH